MKLDVLLSCMHQRDDGIVSRSRITGSAVVVNQCGQDKVVTRSWGTMIFSSDRGLTRSRNLALAHSDADICLLCDDDEEFLPDYEEKILTAYESLPRADVIVFKMVHRPSGFPDRVVELKFPQTLRVCSWQISFRRERLLRAGIRFDELLGAGTGNGAEEELKFLLDCQRAGLKIFYVPREIASVAQTASTWFHGFDRDFFYNRGAATRYILGLPLAAAYGLYYVLRKRAQYRGQISMAGALAAIFRGIADNRIQKQKEERP